MLYEVRATQKLTGTLILKFSKDRNFRLTKGFSLNLTEEEYLSSKVQNMLRTKYIEDIVITKKPATPKKEVELNVETVSQLKAEVSDATKSVSWDGETKTLLNAKESKEKVLDNMGSTEIKAVSGITIDLDGEPTEEKLAKKEKKPRKNQSKKQSKLTESAKRALEQVKKDILNESEEPDPDFVFENSKQDVGFVDQEQQAVELAKIAHLEDKEMEL